METGSRFVAVRGWGGGAAGGTGKALADVCGISSWGDRNVLK